MLLSIANQILGYVSFQSGATAVHLAASKGHTNVVRCLLLHGIEVDDRDVVSSISFLVLCH